MGIITKEVMVKPTGKMIQYYKDKGYDAKYRESLIVKVEDLSMGSEILIDVICDYCEETICHPTYKNYYKRIKKYGKFACHKCGFIHQKLTCLANYGVDAPAKSEKVKECIRKTCLQKYGTENPMQNSEIKKRFDQSICEKYGVDNISRSLEVQEKRKNTFIEKYQTTNPFGNKEIQNKISNTLMLRYNVKSPLQIPEVKEKVKKSFVRKYGFDNPNKSPIIRAKTAQTLYKNNTTPTSRQQLYIFSLYNQNNNAKLNYPVSYYNMDICFPEEKLVIEYDGGGHCLQATLGKLTQEEFDQKEIIRYNIVKRAGYKQMRISSSKDKLPSDIILLEMLSYARNYFSEFPNHSWIEFDIDSSTVRNAENKEGVFFNYGELRKIKDTDLNKSEEEVNTSTNSNFWNIKNTDLQETKTA